MTKLHLNPKVDVEIKFANMEYLEEIEDPQIDDNITIKGKDKNNFLRFIVMKTGK